MAIQSAFYVIVIVCDLVVTFYAHVIQAKLKSPATQLPCGLVIVLRTFCVLLSDLPA